MPDFESGSDFSVTFWRNETDDKNVQVTTQVENAEDLDNRDDKNKKAQVGVQVGVQVEKLLSTMTNNEFTTREIQLLLNLKQRHKTFANYIQPALKYGFIEMTIPDKPNSRLQKYRLTEKGREMKNKR